MTSLISNPPYNMRWNPSGKDHSLPCDVPKSSANFAFVFDGLERVEGRAVFLLPNSVLNSAQERTCRRYLVEQGLLSAVIALPERMFEATSIPVCLLVLDKGRRRDDVLFLDLTKQCGERTRLQRGQYGKNSHSGRMYRKRVRIIQPELADRVCKLVDSREDLPEWAALAGKKELADAEWELAPKRWTGSVGLRSSSTREIGDIVDDLNRVNEYRNTLRLVVNETLARKFGLLESAELMRRASRHNEALNPALKSICGKELMQQDWIMLTRNRNELKFENRHPTELSEILLLILQQHKAHLMFLNNMENRYLVELRDVLLPQLMNGEINVEDFELCEIDEVTTA